MAGGNAPTIKTLRRYQDRLSPKVLRIDGVTGMGIGKTSGGQNRIDVLIARPSRSLKTQVKNIISTETPRLQVRFVRFEVSGAFRPE